MTALGFIETRGLLAAIEGADAMLKAANVRLLEKHLVGGGLVTITVAGEVSAVRSSVDAAIAAIGRIDGSVLVSEHVIARPDEEVSRIIATEPVTVQEQEAESASDSVAEVSVSKESDEAPQAEEAPAEESASAEKSVKVEAPKAAPELHNVSQLKKMKVNRLRQIARSLEGVSLTEDEIKSATKKNLIETIVNAYRQIEE